MKKSTLFLFVIFISVGLIKDSFAQTNYFLIARNTGEKIIASNDTIRVFGFATSLSTQPNVPGPTLYANEGDSVTIDLFNVSQGAPHTIHLHGLDVDQQNDGVGMLSFEVHHMDHGYYRFKAPHPGTYLYHCHVTSPIHVQAGMYGLVIIKPVSGADSTWTGGYAYDDDYSLLMSEIDTVWHNDSVLNHAHDTSQMIHYVPIPYYNPQFFLVNGLSDQQLDDTIEINSSVGAVNYLRLSNLGFYANRVTIPSGLNAVVIDSDGRPLPQTESADTVIVFPGERYGVLTEASTQFTDSIHIEYLDLNTGNVKGEQYIQVNIDGFFDVDEHLNPASALSIYPNPNNGEFVLNFESENSHTLQIEILDYTGKKILNLAGCQVENGEYTQTISLHGLAQGVYLVKVTDENKKSFIFRWILAK